VTELGLALLPENPMTADRVQVDIFQATSIPGVSAAGDMAMPAPQVSAAIATGAMAAASIVRALTGRLSTAPAPRG
jgi:thioredoxin reductase